MAGTVDAAQIQYTYNEQTHDLAVNAVQTLPDGTQQPLAVSVPGYRYDATAALLPQFVVAAALTNGSAGPIVPADVARFWCEVENLINEPQPPQGAATIDTGTAQEIGL